MFGIRNASAAVVNSADAITALSEDVQSNLSEWSSDVRRSTELAAVLIIGAFALSVVAVVLAVVAVADRD